MNEEEKKAIERMKQVLAKNVHTFVNKLEIVLNLIEKLQKENEELKIIKSLIETLELNQMQEDQYVLMTKRDFLSGSCKSLLDDYIPVQKVKDKIEEVEKRKQEYEEENTIDEDYLFDGYNSAIFVLQELLEKED